MLQSCPKLSEYPHGQACILIFSYSDLKLDLVGFIWRRKDFWLNTFHCMLTVLKYKFVEDNFYGGADSNDGESDSPLPLLIYAPGPVCLT